MFSSDGFRHAFLSAIKDRSISGHSYEDGVESTLDALANHLEACLDLDAMLKL